MLLDFHPPICVHAWRPQGMNPKGEGGEGSRRHAWFPPIYRRRHTSERKQDQIDRVSLWEEKEDEGKKKVAAYMRS